MRWSESGCDDRFYARAVINATGEPWRFGIDNTPPVRERVVTFLESCGLSLEEQRNFGPEGPETCHGELDAKPALLIMFIRTLEVHCRRRSSERAARRN